VEILLERGDGGCKNIRKENDCFNLNVETTSQGPIQAGLVTEGFLQRRIVKVACASHKDGVRWMDS
jgi:hypothetical protein